MLSIPIKRLTVTFLLSLVIIGGPAILEHGETSATSNSFIRCEGNNCDTKCTGGKNPCGLNATCCAKQYYEDGECEDSMEDTFTCYGEPKEGEGGEG